MFSPLFPPIHPSSGARNRSGACDGSQCVAPISLDTIARMASWCLKRGYWQAFWTMAD